MESTTIPELLMDDRPLWRRLNMVYAFGSSSHSHATTITKVKRRIIMGWNFQCHRFSTWKKASWKTAKQLDFTKFPGFKTINILLLWDCLIEQPEEFYTPIEVPLIQINCCSWTARTNLGKSHCMLWWYPSKCSCKCSSPHKWLAGFKLLGGNNGRQLQEGHRHERVTVWCTVAKFGVWGP